MIDNIFFDFNGTILDDLELTYELLLESLEKYNLPFVSLEQYRNLFCFPVKKYYENVGFDFNKINFNELATDFINQYSIRQEKETRLFENCKETLEKLKNKGFHLYILTATEYSLLVKQLNHLGIHNYFDGLIAANNNLAMGKIDYGKLYIKEHNIDLSKSIMIGDTVHDYEVSKEIGMECLLFTKGHNTKENLSKIGKTVDSYIDIYDYFSRLK